MKWEKKRRKRGVSYRHSGAHRRTHGKIGARHVSGARREGLCGTKKAGQIVIKVGALGRAPERSAAKRGGREKSPIVHKEVVNLK